MTKVFLIGGGNISESERLILLSKNHDVEIITPEQAKELGYPAQTMKPMIITNPYLHEQIFKRPMTRAERRKKKRNPR